MYPTHVTPSTPWGILMFPTFPPSQIHQHTRIDCLPSKRDCQFVFEVTDDSDEIKKGVRVKVRVRVRVRVMVREGEHLQHKP